MSSQLKIIEKVNQLLINKFGIPKRNHKLPKPLDLLIATILSQNTNDNNSYKAFQNLKNRYKFWNELLLEKRTNIEKHIRIAGLAGQKSNTIKNLIVELNKIKDLDLNYLKKLNDEQAIEQLIKFHGVGIKTASCVLLFALGRNVCPVDTHVHRTVNRIGIVSEKTPDKTFFALNKDFPASIAHSFHTNLIRLGREICKSQNPSCGICPIMEICKYKSKNLSMKKSGPNKEFMLLDNVK